MSAFKEVKAEPNAAPDNSAPPPRPALTSLIRYSPGLILIAIAVADISRFADPDIWGHVRFGQEVLRQHHIVWFDPYSFTAFGHSWLNHEWLTELIMGALYNLLGGFGLKLMKLGCVAVTIFFMAAAMAETGAPTLIQFAILIAAAVGIAPQIQFRPQVFTFALLSVLIYLLTRDLYGRRSRLWLAIPIMALWANLHGGFILGIAALAIYTGVLGAQDIVAGRGLNRFVRLAAITIAATLATLATPYGIGTWLAVLHALSNPFTRIVIVDWQPLTQQFATQFRDNALSVMYLQLGISLIAVLIFSFILTPFLDDLPLIAIAAVMSVAAFVSVRNVPTAVIAVTVPLARHLPAAMQRRWPSIGPHSGPSERSSILNQAVLAIVAIMVFVQSGLFSNVIGAVDPFPVAACNFVKEHKLRGNLMTQFSWGEYAIWHLPESKVFVDGRYDTVYPNDVLQDFLFFNFNRPGGEQVFIKYPTEYVLIPPESQGRKIIDARKDWQLIYKDKTSLLYARSDSAAAHLKGVPITGVALPTFFP